MAAHSNGTAINEPMEPQFGNLNEPNYESKHLNIACFCVFPYFRLQLCINCINQTLLHNSSSVTLL